MKIIKLHIYGFGRFQNYQIELPRDPIFLILGENEAGKSTLMAFIRCILFGFPTKQSNELRYEPRLGGRYGGSIVIESIKYGRVTIERISGKAVGDVKLYFEDGTIGNEVELNLILGEIDRTTYRGIYSFGLTDLQSLEHLHSDEINKFMFGVGIAGRNNLLEIEKKNEKVLQTLYKPTGRKPIINEQVSKVIEAEESMASWRKKRNQYEQLTNERASLAKRIEKGNDVQLELNRSYRYFEKLRSIALVVQNKKMYENRLEQLPPYEPFPVDGLQRLEALNENCVEAEGELNVYRKKLELIFTEKQKLVISSNLTELEQSVGEVKESRKLYETKKDELGLLLQQIQFEQQEYRIMLDKLGYDHADFETGYVAEEKLTVLIEQEVKLKQHQIFLQSQYEQARKTLEEKENIVKSLKLQLLDEKTKLDLERKVAEQSTEKDLKQQLAFIDNSLQTLSNQSKYFQKEKNSRSTLLFVIGIITSVLGATILIFNDQWLLAAVLLITVVTSLILSKWATNKSLHAVLNDLKQEKEKQEENKLKLQEQLKMRNNSLFEHDHMLLQRDQERREQLQLLKQTLIEATNHFEYSCKELDKSEITMTFFQEQLGTWANDYRYPIGLDATHYLKLLKMMEELKKKNRQISFIEAKASSLKMDLEKLEKKVEKLCMGLSLPYNLENFQQNVERLSNYLSSELEKEKVVQRFSAEANQFKEAIQSVEAKRNQYQLEIEKLWKNAHVNTEEEFRQKGNAWVESQEIKAKLRVYNSQIIPVLSSDTTLEQLESDVLSYQDILEDKITEIETNLTSLRAEERKLLERVAKIELEIAELEEGSNYSLSLHNLEIEKGILNVEVKKWALHRTVQFLIDEAKKVYEKERQPQVVKEATRMFKYLTDGEYIQLTAPIGEQRFIVERQDGLKFQPNELSQGTKEQLYLALRFALATVHSKQTSFPILMDDILVNFDRERRLKAIELIKEISKEHQIIFFTCHPFMATEISNHHFLLTGK
ncbi:hypothetical protein DS745_13440 [Anaerobacillus alkaliphilus]|uniref:YhaN AAA domain-containing protein n=1 Tax=Anaerobacillus alkaliphilus TaxID=1548597 RepID=A0A4Q0VU97_9BACI|nr:AAA family ATPase [Anaerobacillus alkaliphilus]RXI99877.1 hypothetical protein DS745_13440 [Anaerobacillus alkaliphilus]